MCPTRPETAPGAWVLRCPACAGGLVYALATPATERMLLDALRFEVYGIPEVEHGPIDRLWEIEYCTCTEDCP